MSRHASANDIKGSAAPGLPIVRSNFATAKVAEKLVPHQPAASSPCGAQAEVQMVDPNGPELLAALETFANEVQEILNSGEQDAETGPIAARQKQYMFGARYPIRR
jgi:hypothetical protein